MGESNDCENNIGDSSIRVWQQFKGNDEYNNMKSQKLQDDMINSLLFDSDHKSVQIQ